MYKGVRSKFFLLAVLSVGLAMNNAQAPPENGPETRTSQAQTTTDGSEQQAGRSAGDQSREDQLSLFNIYSTPPQKDLEFSPGSRQTHFLWDRNVPGQTLSTPGLPPEPYGANGRPLLPQ